MADLAGRVAKLEQDNRRLKRAGLAVAAVLVAVPLAGATLPRQVPEVVTARAFRVLDEAGNLWARLDPSGLAFHDAIPFGPRTTLTTDGLFFYDADLEGRTTLDFDGLSLHDDDGKSLTTLTTDGLFFYGADGEVRTILNAYGLSLHDDDGKRLTTQIDPAGLHVYDGDKKIRAQIGAADLVTPSTGAETHYPAAVVLFDADGNVIWKEPR